jgi:hypothetical protein
MSIPIFSIPDPESWGQKSTGSQIRIRNVGPPFLSTQLKLNIPEENSESRGCFWDSAVHKVFIRRTLSQESRLTIPVLINVWQKRQNYTAT